jgi:hypothetical protein
MTRDKAIEVNRILCRIEDYEAVLEELEMSEAIGVIHEAYGEGQSLYEELKAVVQKHLDEYLKQLEEM